MKFRAITLFGACTLIALGSVMITSAKPGFASKEKKKCDYCHLRPSGGGARGFRGLYYAANRLSFKGFDEKVQAAAAGVKENAVGPASKPTKKPYPVKTTPK